MAEVKAGGYVQGQGPAARPSSHAGATASGRAPDGQGVGLGVEHVGVQAEQGWVVREEQVQVLQRLPQKETLHFVPGLWIVGILDVADGRIATRGDLPKAEPVGHSGRYSVLTTPRSALGRAPARGTPRPPAHCSTHGQGKAWGTEPQGPRGKRLPWRPLWSLQRLMRQCQLPSSDQLLQPCGGLTAASHSTEQGLSQGAALSRRDLP